jgi:hypothetical protein
MEKLVRRMVQANRDASERYLERHAQSNARKKDGWVKKFKTNTKKARAKGWKKLKLRFR